MLGKLRKYLNRYPAIRKIGVTVLILSIYIFGTHIVVPGVNQSGITLNVFFVQASQVTGGNYQSINLFSLGLGPYMSGMILWRLVGSQKLLDISKMTERQSNAIRMGIMLSIGVIQTLNLLLNIETVSIGNLNETIIRLSIMLTLLAGMCLLIWLGNLNVARGVGGMTVIVMINILFNLMRQMLTLLNGQQYLVFGIMAIIMIILSFVCVLFDRSERRLPLIRGNISSDYADKTYLPIKVNPAGGMPIMYALSIFAIPQYLSQIFLYFSSQQGLVVWLSQNMRVTSPFGLTLYLMIIIFLTIGFGFLNVDPVEVAKQLQKGGDYFEGIRPGVATRDYLHGIVLRLSSFGALYLTCLSGIPLAYGVVTQTTSPLYYLPGTLMFLIGMMLSIIDELEVLFLNHRYKTVLGDILK